MNKLESLLSKYENNFLLLDEFSINKEIEYLNFHNIVTVTDTNLVKVSAIHSLIDFLKENFNSKLILLNPSEPNYEMIETTSKKLFSGQYDLVIALGGGSILDLVKASSVYENAFEKLTILLVPKNNIQKKY